MLNSLITVATCIRILKVIEYKNIHPPLVTHDLCIILFGLVFILEWMEMKFIYYNMSKLSEIFWQDYCWNLDGNKMYAFVQLNTFL